MRSACHLKTTTVAALFAFGLSCGTAAAMSQSEVKRFDVDGDGYIEKGAESRALEAAFGRLNGQQQARVGRFLSGSEEKLAVGALDFKDVQNALAAACTVRKSLYLAESIAGVSLVHPDIVSTSDKGARFSVSHDNVSGTTSWAVEGVAIIAPMANRCLHASSSGPLPNGALTGYTIAPYLSFSGTGSSTAVGNSDLRTGAVLDLQFFGGAFDLQQLQFSPFYRTDFQGAAQIYGASLSWTPFHFTSRLNGLQGDADHRGVDYRLGADIEYLNGV